MTKGYFRKIPGAPSVVKLAAPPPVFARRRCNLGVKVERVVRGLRVMPIMTQARSTIVFGFNALQRGYLSAAGQKARGAGQGLPGAGLLKGV